MMPFTTTLRCTALGAASLFVIALTSLPAAAQSPYGGNTPAASSSEDVVVTAPRYHARRSDIGAPIENVSLTREVRFGDLDLRTGWGSRALRERVRETAQALCRQIDEQYVVTEDGSPPCYTTAVRDALAQADSAILEARRTAANE